MRLATLSMIVMGTGLAPGEVAEFPKLGLAVAAPPLEELEYTDRVPEEIAGSDEDQHAFDQRRLGLWTGELGESQVSAGLHVYEGSRFLNEPGDVNDHAITELRARDGSYADVAIRYQAGAFGYAPFAQVAEGEVRDTEGTTIGVQFLLGGLLQHDGYVLHVRCVPAPDEEGRRVLLGYLEEAVAYEGPERDPRWTLDEARERWLRDTPEDLHEDFVFKLSKSSYVKKAVVRTEHYIILTNSSSGKLFAKKMEENYDRIAKIFRFEEVEGMRLMPVFLFRTRDQYNEFYAAITNRPIASVRKSGGHAWADYYATWYESPNDPVHVHECTHQIFRNRMGLGGGGSWYQEGVAEYVETRESDRNVVARLVKDGEHIPLSEFVTMQSLLHSSTDSVKGGSGAAAADAYKQAALLIEFLRESEFGEGKFEEFVYTMGRLPRGDREAIEAAFLRIYDADLVGVDAAWQEYCEKR